MLILQGVTYTHPDRDLLFADIDLIINKGDKIALIGNNGVGKSTLLKILAGKLHPSGGVVRSETKPYYVPQLFGQFNDYNVAQALQIEGKLKALKEILDGHVTEANLEILDDDWAIEQRCHEAFAHWKLPDLKLNQEMKMLSGGQKTRIFLAGIMIHCPEIVLLDEPTNHLDIRSRNILYDYTKTTTNTLVTVSHDRTLLNLLNVVYELDKNGVTAYGGNYDFYVQQKKIETHALNQNVKNKQKTLRKAKETEKESLERKQKLDVRGKKKQEKAGLPTILMNTLRNNAEKSTSRMKDIHAEKVDTISQELGQLRERLPDLDKMKLDVDNSSFYKGKIIVTATDLNFGYDDQLLWNPALNFQIKAGDRIVIKGLNGSGKTTLLKIILGELKPKRGSINRAGAKVVYIDQDYSLVDNNLTVYEQAEKYNIRYLGEHEVKIRLNRFLFTKTYWNKPCKALSGGEKMRLLLCSLTISNQAPDIIVLDEPTNNLDIQNMEILTTAINEYQGVLLIVSHDEYFLKRITAENYIMLQ
mgnify:CR=1 FL=1